MSRKKGNKRGRTKGHKNAGRKDGGRKDTGRKGNTRNKNGKNERTQSAPKSRGQHQVQGKLTVHPDGFGFVFIEAWEESVFIPPPHKKGAMDGDQVSVECWESEKGWDGRVQQVLGHTRTKVTGQLVKSEGVFMIKPDDPRIVVDFPLVTLTEKPGGNAKEGFAVVADIHKYPTENRGMVATVMRVLGDPDDPLVETEKILACAEIPLAFSPGAIKQAEATATEVTEADLANREDLRDRDFITIDPVTARDFDDALCVETGPHGGPRVRVAVADVSHYVKIGDAIDKDAQPRGVSVYLPDRVIPMLPHELSTGICSLNPDVERCAMVVSLDLNDNGDVVGTDFCAAVIRSKGRFDYPSVAAALHGDFRGPRRVLRRWSKDLEELDRLARAMRAKRMARGALDLDLEEAKIILDDDDPRLIRNVVRAKADPAVKVAYQLVEEFMIAANEAVGRYFEEHQRQPVWRIHAPPELSKLEELRDVLMAFGISVDPEQATSPQGLQAVLKQLEDHPASSQLSFFVLRSLKQASYDTQRLGHFGLASESYLHFTSPIRRYADLVVHRELKRILKGKKKPFGDRIHVEYRGNELDELAKATSEGERKAMQIERDTKSMYKAFFARELVGEVKEGIVSGMATFGFFVQLNEPFIEGLVKLASLPSSYRYYQTDQRIIDRSSGREIRLGAAVQVRVTHVSVPLRRIDFEFLAP